MISFTFDDGNNCIRTVVEPILSRYGMVGTVGAICDLVFWDQARARNFMRPGDLRYLAEIGWEIASHSLFHRCMSLLPPSYEDETASWRFDKAVGSWVANGRWEDVGTVAYRGRYLPRAKSAAEFTVMSEAFLIEPGNPTVYVKSGEAEFTADELRFGSAERELAESREVFRQHGFDTDVFIVPLNAWSPALQEMANKYYSFVACQGWELNTRTSILDRQLARIRTGKHVSLEDILAKVEEHLSQDSWPIILFHRIEPEMKGKWNWTTAQFESLVRWVSDRGIPVYTLSEAARRLRNYDQ
jgi:peptidoglycan/xylan/chitin deacetylase (PgdA/CDA1 family)